MSGGFFRGTSADQDTRFSNKQAKLLKSQKFAAELEHLVDMTKVKMDVIRPWIANRVTELLGFEDEVLINFIYGLLDGKEVNGKEVQISLTGFMEKNTGKFMKELWTLLLSAQKTVSGVPQQFLDAKEEETRKKKAEVDRMANELEKKKEKESRELEQERFKKMDGAVEPKATNSALEPASKHMLPKSSIAHPEENKEADETNGMRGSNRVSRSPHSVDRSSSSPSMRHKSRSVSRSPGLGGRSISSDRMYRSPRRRSVTPHSRHSPRASISPSRRRSSYSRLRSRSRSPRRSPSVRRRLRSPYQRRSLTPVRRHRSSPFRRRRSPSPVRQYRSPSPVRRYRSPLPGRRYISPSPVRRGRSPSFVRRGRSPSPVRRGRSPSPVRRGRSPSPVRRRSPLPVRRRSPLAMRRRSPSPVQRRSPSPLQRISRSPMQRRYQRSSSMQSKSPMPGRRRSRTPKGRSPSPYYSSSPSPIRHRSLSPLRRESPKDHGGSPVLSSEERRSHEKLSPVAHRPSTSLKSPHGDSKDRKDFRNQKYASSPSRDRSRSPLDSPPHARKGSACDQHKRSSPHRSPVRKTRERMIGDGSWSPRKSREQKPYHDSPKTSEEEKETCRAREDKDHESKSSGRRSMQSSTASKQKDLSGRLYYKEEHSPERLARNRRDHMESKKDLERKREKSSGRGTQNETPDQQISPSLYKDSGEGKNSEDRNRSHKDNVKDTDWRRKPVKASKVDDNNGGNNFDSGSEESDKHRAKNKEKRKHKRSERKEVASDEDCSYDSELEDRKEAKRRKREEKKLRKEERRRRREERRHRREERRAEKRKMKNQNASDTSDGEHLPRSESHRSDNEGTESEQKKLEIELRNKALESLKAKKGISH